MVDTDPHQKLLKNGHERVQDREIRSLFEELSKHRAQEEEWNRDNAEVHTQLMRSVTRQNVLIGIAAAMFSTLIAWLGTLWVKIDNVEERLEEQHKADQLRNDAHSYKGEQWGTTMERDIEKNRRQLRELEQRLFGRRKQE